MKIKKIHFFTFATSKNHHLDRLLSSSKKHGIDIKILGMGEPYQGNGMKITLLLDALQALSEDDYFMYVDAYDVIFLTNEEEIIQKYSKEYSKELVFGGEQNFGMYSFDDIYYYLKYPLKNDQFKFLNAGTMMGPAQSAIAIYQDINMSKSQKSDQMDTIRYFCNNQSQIKIDNKHELFGVNGGRAGLESMDYKIKNDRLYCTATDTWPALLHIPGKFFIGLDQLSKDLGFMQETPDYTEQEKKAYIAAKKDHQLCDKLGIDNYKLRLMKNWTTNFLIIGLIYGLTRIVLALFK